MLTTTTAFSTSATAALQEPDTWLASRPKDQPSAVQPQKMQLDDDKWLCCCTHE